MTKSLQRQATAIFAFAILALPAASVGAQDETERVSRVVKLQPGGTLRLKSFSGHVTIAATDGSDVVIDAVRRAPRERLDRIKLEIRSESSTVEIEANHRDSSWFNSRHNNVVETDFDIKVPKRTNIDVDVFSSPVEVKGVEGSHRVHTFSGRIAIDDGTGAMQAHSFSGPIEIRTRSWQERQTIDVDTFSGNVRLHVPESARGDVSFRSFSGHLDSDVPLTLRTSSRRSLEAVMGSGPAGGTVRVKTFSGNVRIDK